jgi:uncharacterized protein DUF1559
MSSSSTARAATSASTTDVSSRFGRSAERFQFRIRDLLLLTTLAALGIAACLRGSLILLLVAIAACAISLIFVWKPLLVRWLIAITLLGNLVVGLWPMPLVYREPSRRLQCTMNLRQIGVALHTYHDVYGCLPPAYIADENGRPMHSWRVLILPFLEEQALYDQYDFSEPWDGPNNRSLAAQAPACYSCPDALPNKPLEAHYLAIVGPRTAWPGDKSSMFKDFKDGTDNVLVVVEVQNSGISWMEPRDLDVALAIQAIQATHTSERLGAKRNPLAHVLVGDGRIRVIDSRTKSNVLKSMLRIDDGTVGGQNKE